MTRPSAITQSAIVTAVLQILAGTPIEMAAARAGMTSHDLAGAVQTYHSAGAAAVDAQAASGWYHIRVQFPHWRDAEQHAATAIAPQLRRLQADGMVTSWWFIRKYPHWRLRLRRSDQDPDGAAVIEAVLDDLIAARAITQWCPGIYEPETAAFGGPPGIDIAHRLFCADSDHILRYIVQPHPGIGRREMSLVLCRELLDSAGLDHFEHGDVWHRIAVLRPIPATVPPSRLNELDATIHNLNSGAARSKAALSSQSLPAASLPTWVQAFSQAGHDLETQAAQGSLSRGIRNVLAHLVIFHWNRLGLTAITQGVIARAAAELSLPAG